MIREEIYNPLEQYRKVYKEKFHQVAASTFEELATASGIDVNENKATCDELQVLKNQLDKISTHQALWHVLVVLLCFLMVMGGIVVWIILDSNYTFLNQGYDFNRRALIGTICILIGILCALFFWIFPKLNKIGKKKEVLEANIQELTDKAWQQMEPLNKLYDWDIFARMMSETVPKLEFDPFFTTQRLADLQRVYDWDDSFNEGRSVLFSHSGLINGNPFVLCRTKKMRMGSKTYYGYKTIHWTSSYKDSKGKRHTVRNTQVLTGSYTAPFPEYYKKTWLMYGNTAAPELCFDRIKNTFNGKQGSLSFKWKLHKLKKQAEQANSNFVLMNNEKFEVMFNTANRNNEQQFRLLFTPLAQESMLALILDKEEGYGDDFDFSKKKMINTIIADHMQHVDFDMDPSHFRHFNFEFAKNNFVKINAEYFRAMYFCLAPLLCVPMYQQIRTPENIYGFGCEKKSAFWEHESLANFWGEDNFRHPQCVTDSILKTSERDMGDGRSVITVHAHGYKAMRHIYYDKVWGGDGKLHPVPVEWFEFLPVVGKGNIYMNEDTQDYSTLSPLQRQEHISDRLSDVGGDGIYRRHIASHI